MYVNYFNIKSSHREIFNENKYKQVLPKSKYMYEEHLKKLLGSQ